MASATSLSTTNALQRDYKRYPKRCRGSPEQVAMWMSQTREGKYDLGPDETFWRDIQPFLLERGYALRPRFRPGWSPSWLGTDINPFYCEDSLPTMLPWVMDARRPDDSVVAIKWIPDAEHTQHELEIMRFLSSEELRKDPRNRTVALLDTFPHPSIMEGIFIVMPWLGRLTRVPVTYVNELVDFMLQSFDGLAFLHEHGVAHRDCVGPNIMIELDTLFPRSVRWHPQRVDHTADITGTIEPRRRWKANARYLFIDFGISHRFVKPGPHLATGTIGRDQDPPELSDDVPYDPFKLDVYILANFFAKRYLNVYTNLEFLRPLLVRMMRPNPRNRPSMEEALAELRILARKPTGIVFKWRLESRGATSGDHLFNCLDSLYQGISTLVRVPVFGLRQLRFGRSI